MNSEIKQIYNGHYQKAQKTHSAESKPEMKEIFDAFSDRFETEFEVNAFCCVADLKKGQQISSEDLKKVETFTMKKAAQIKTSQDLQKGNVATFTDKQSRAYLCKQAAMYLCKECGEYRWSKGHSLPLSIKVIIAKEFDGKLTVHNFRENLERK